MNKHLFFGLIICFLLPFTIQAQTQKERLIYSTDFTNWDALSSSTTATTVSKTTSFSNEVLNFTLQETQVSPTGTNAAKFTYPPASTGYAMAAKSSTGYIQTSALASITKVQFTQGATGSGRGYKIYKKGDGDADWVLLSDSVASPAGGDIVHVTVNTNNCALRFENINPAQNAYLFDLQIYGNVTLTADQKKLTTTVSPTTAGTITTNPQGTEFDKDSQVTLTATRNFGYQFDHWANAAGDIISTDNPFTYTLVADTTLTAVFKTIPTYALNLAVGGGAADYMVALSPEATVVNNKNMYEEGTNVLLTSANNTIFTFNNWENGSTQATRTVTMSADQNLTATYSAASYIVGWDFVSSKDTKDRAADFASVTDNTGMIQLIDSVGTDYGWLAKSGVSYNEGKNAIISWQTPATKAYFQATFSTKNYKNIQVKSQMMYNYFAWKKQQLQYSTDGKIFTTAATITFSGTKTWTDLDAVLPDSLADRSKIYLRWIPDYTGDKDESISTTSDGTSITNIFVLGDNVQENDTTAPTLLSSIPVADATDVSASGSIILHFDEAVKAGTGDCTLDGETLTPKYSNTTVVFPYSGLSYNTSYTFAISAGAIQDLSGNKISAISIPFTTMQRTQPDARLYDAVVSADGSGDYTTVQACINAAPVSQVKPYLIFVKNGTYKEHVSIPSTKPYIHLIGQDVSKVIITDDLLCGGTVAETGQAALSVSDGSTFVAGAANFFAENISFENSWGITKNAGPQALALYTNNDRIILNKCRLRSYQDTYLTSTNGIADRHYLKNCFIEGAVDFIYGAGDVFFDNCKLNIVRTSGGYIVAPCHRTGTSWGYVFYNDTITAPTSTSVWLGRPWQNSPKAVFINTTSQVTIPAAGWSDHMGAIPAIFADYNTMDADGNKMDLSNRISSYYYTDDSGNKVTGTSKSSLTDAEAATYTIKNVLSGSDSWLPAIETESVDAPVVSVNKTVMSWPKVNYAICYIVLQGDSTVSGFTKNLTYTGVSGVSYVVKAVNEYGGFSKASNVVTANSSATGIDENTSGLNIYSGDHYLQIDGLTSAARIQVYTLSGVLASSVNVSDSTITIPLHEGNYVLKVTMPSKVISKVVNVK